MVSIVSYLKIMSLVLAFVIKITSYFYFKDICLYRDAFKISMPDELKQIYSSWTTPAELKQIY